MDGRRLTVISALGTAQTHAWGSSYYLPAILADPIARVGRQIDRVGGRQVLCTSNIVLALGLALLGASSSPWAMSAAWLLLGVGMGLGLYDARRL